VAEPAVRLESRRRRTVMPPDFDDDDPPIPWRCDVPADARRILVVANRTSATPRVIEAVKRYAREQPTKFSLLIPDAAKGDDWTLELALPLLERAAGSRVEGLVESAGDPYEAIRKHVTDGGYERVVISTLPRRVSKWLKRDLPRRVAALGTPVEVITPEKAFIASYMPTGITDVAAGKLPEKPREGTRRNTT
jgi:hypothetical protein